MAKTSNQLGQSVYIQEKSTLPSVYEGEFVNVLGVVYFWDDVASIYKEVGSGGGAGGINYIENADAEINTTGWATYTDASAATPADGTGTPPTTELTWTRSPSSPLRGTANFLLTKDGSDRRGMGVSYDFTIDSADQGKILRVSFDYKTSAAYADSDVRVYIYRTTATAKLIELSVRDLAANTVNGTYMSEFQTDSDATGYRLILHVASVNASAYTIQADNFSVGPREIARGSVVTDWVSYTPTVTNVTTSATALRWRRIGDSIQVAGSITYSAAPTGSVIVSIPSGMTRDSNKVATNGLVGQVNYYDASADTNYTAYAYVDSSSRLLFIGQNQSNEGSPTTATVFNATRPVASPASGDSLELFVTIPITGWSSNANISSDFGNRLISFRARRATTNQTVVPNTDTTVLFNTVDHDKTSSYATGTGIWTCPESGTYNFSARIRCDSLASAEGLNVKIIKGASTELARLYDNLASTIRIVTLSTGDVDLVVGDTIKVTLASDTGNYDVVAVTYTNFSGSKIQSPQTLMGGEVVALRYYNTSGQSMIDNTNTTITGWTKDYDDHNLMVAATGLTTIRQAGKYRITLKAHLSIASGTNIEEFYVNILRNATAFYGTIMNNLTVVTTVAHGASMTVTLDCVAGDVITPRVYQKTGGNKSLNGTAHLTDIEIVKVN
jgi:hypothetical protein